MTIRFASRHATPHAQAGTMRAILREIDAAFEALARRRYDAPWQRVALPRRGDPHEAR